MQHWKKTDHKIKGWKTQDQKTMDQITGVKNAGLVNDGRNVSNEKTRNK